MRGKWTLPADVWPSSHLLSVVLGQSVTTRCGRHAWLAQEAGTTDEPPARGKTCESCLRLSRRDG